MQKFLYNGKILAVRKNTERKRHMIKIKNLTKKYGSIYAIKDVTFEVQKGEIVGFLGPNGAGKSTTMNILTGYLPATSGQVSIAGHSIMGEPLEVKKRIGYLPEIPPLYMDMRVEEYLRYVAKLKRVSKNEINKQLEEVMDKLKIVDVRGRMIKNLSKGYKQRVGFAQALLGKPEVLILDEPTVGMDPEQIIEIRELIKSLGKEHTVILSSHILSEVSAVCSRVVIINKGEIVAIDTPDNLSDWLDDGKRLNVVLEGTKDTSSSVLSEVDGVKNIDVIDESNGCVTYKIECDPQIDVEKNIFFALADKDIPLREMKHVETSLEDVFLKIIKSNKKYNADDVVNDNTNDSVNGNVNDDIVSDDTHDSVNAIENEDADSSVNNSVDNDVVSDDANDSVNVTENEDANNSVNDSVDNAVSDDAHDSVSDGSVDDSEKRQSEGDKDDTNI